MFFTLHLNSPKGRFVREIQPMIEMKANEINSDRFSVDILGKMYQNLGLD